VVKINSSLSVTIEVHSGIGQGSIVGATFFLVFFNDSDDSLVETKGLNFADDKKIVHNNISSLAEEITEEITYRRDYLTFSPFNFACRLFNLAAIHVDPTLPSREFRRSVVDLDDSVFGSFATC